MDKTAEEIAIVDACTEIGNIAGSNASYTAGITRKIQKTGKTIGELTVNEILEIHRQYKNEFNELYK